MEDSVTHALYFPGQYSHQIHGVGSLVVAWGGNVHSGAEENLCHAEQWWQINIRCSLESGWWSAAGSVTTGSYGSWKAAWTPLTKDSRSEGASQSGLQ